MWLPLSFYFRTGQFGYNIIEAFKHPIAQSKGICYRQCFKTGITCYEPQRSWSFCGVVLVSNHKTCRKCGGKLLHRSDRPSRVTLYTESQGTLLVSHFIKFCQNYRKGCSYNQHYGYYSMGTKSTCYYETDWEKRPYLISISQTAFELEFLKGFDFELWIGEMSYKQKSEIYNCVNGYEKCSSAESTTLTLQHN